MKDWYDFRFTNRARINLTGTKVTADHTGFVLMVDLSRFSNSFWSVVQSDLRDLRFTDSSGVFELPYDLVRYDYAAKTGVIYIKTPYLDSNASEIHFYMYYGNPAVTSYSPTHLHGSQAVWQGNGYEAVYHFTEAPLLGATIHDSTSNARHGTVVGSALTQVSTSQAGGGYQFILNEEHYISTVDFDLFGKELELTVSALVKPGNSNGTVVSHNDSGNNVPFHLNVTGSGNLGRQGFKWNTSGWKGANLGRGDLQNAPNWTKVDGTLLSTSSSMVTRYYANGSQTAQKGYSSSNPVQDNPNAMTIGAHVTQGDYYVGLIDEVRISSVVRSADWLSLEYDMFTDSTSVYTIDLYEVYTEPEIVSLGTSSGTCNICLDVKLPDEEIYRRLDLKESPKLGFVYAIADLQKTNKPQSFYSTQIELPDTKNNSETLHKANLINHSKSLIGVELDCRLTINGVVLENATGKFILNSVTLDDDKKNVLYKGRIVGSRYLWLNAIKDLKFCEGNFFLDKVTLRKSDVETSWDTSAWGWTKGFTMIPMNYGKWRKLNKVTYQDLRPSVYVRYLIEKISELTDYTFVSTFFNSEYFGRLILPFVREDFGIPQEYADNNEFLASVYDTRQTIALEPSTNQALDYDTLGGFETIEEVAVLTAESYTNSENEYVANFDSGYNFSGTKYTIPSSSSKYGGLDGKFILSYTIAWVNETGNDLVGTEYDGEIQPNERRYILGTRIRLDGGGWYPTRYTQNIGRVEVDLVHEDSLGTQTVLQTKTHVLALGNLSDASRDIIDDDPWSGVFNLDERCFNPDDSVFVKVRVIRDKTTELFKKPSSWADHKLRTLEEANPSAEFGGTPPTRVTTNVVIEDMNFGFEISRDICGDFETNIANFIHCDVTVKGLLDSLTHMYNLVWQTNPITKEIYVEPDPTFYKIHGVTEDWDCIIDRGKPIELKPNKSSGLSCDRLVYKRDSSDGYVSGFEEKNNVRYLGQDSCASGVTTYNITEKENPLFAPTHYILDKALISDSNTSNVQYLPPAFPRFWKEYEPTSQFLQERNYGFSPRILYYAGLKSYSLTQGPVTYQTSDWIYEDTTQSQFPHAYMVSPYDSANSTNLSFTKNVYRHIRGELSSISGFDFSKSIYELYWEDFQERQLNNTAMTAYVNLNILNIKNLDFRRPKYIMNAKWLLSNIREWNPCLRTAKANFVLAEKVDRAYLQGTDLEPNKDTFVLLGALSGNSFIELDKARFGDWSSGQYQIAGEIRNSFSGDLQGPQEEMGITFEFTYAGSTYNFSWSYESEIDFATDDPIDAIPASDFNTNFRPYITGGVNSSGRIYFLFDKKSWALDKGYAELIIENNTDDYETPFIQNGLSGPAIDIEVEAYTTYQGVDSLKSSIVMKPFIFPKHFNNFSLGITDEFNVAYDYIIKAKSRFDFNQYVDFSDVNQIQFWTDLDQAVPIPMGGTVINPTSQVIVPTYASANVEISGPVASTDSTNDPVFNNFIYIPVDVEVATYKTALPAMAVPEYAYVNGNFIEDSHPTYDEVSGLWKPTGNFLYEYVKHADPVNGVMSTLSPNSVAISTVVPTFIGSGVSAAKTFVGTARPNRSFFEVDDIVDISQNRMTIDEPGLITQTLTVTWNDETGFEPTSFTTVHRFVNTYEKY
jgi:hypothetical protein